MKKSTDSSATASPESLSWTWQTPEQNGSCIMDAAVRLSALMLALIGCGSQTRRLQFLLAKIIHVDAVNRLLASEPLHLLQRLEKAPRPSSSTFRATTILQKTRNSQILSGDFAEILSEVE